MATYSQWARTGPLKPVTWLCGDEAALIRLVLDAYRADTPGDCQFALFAAAGDSGWLWDALLTDSLPEFPRLTIVYGAEKLTSLAPMAALLDGAAAGGSRVVFVSAAADFDQDKEKHLAPHLAVIKGHKSRLGQLIRCCAPSKSEDQVALIASWWPGLTRNQAWTVLRRCGRLTLAAEACDKAVRAGLAPSETAITVVCEAEPGAAFADALVKGDKAGAMAAAQLSGHGETGYGLAVLITKLGQLGAICAAQKAGAGPRDLAARTGMGRWIVSQLAPYASSYDAGRVARCRELLAMAESRHRTGAQAGVAQAVVACW
jgi:hypothetical protein